MALSKEITWQNGVTTAYHRVVDMAVEVNSRAILRTASYVSSESRESESTPEYDSYGVPVVEPIQPYTFNKVYVMPYSDGMTVATAYEYLKTLEEFEGAEDC